jgi:hypothetical protein
MTFLGAKQITGATRGGAEIGILLYPNSRLAAVYGLTGHVLCCEPHE